jgi:hypothetical protein
VNPHHFSAHKGTAKHLNPTEIVKGTHPSGASAKTISLDSKKLAVSYERNISNAIL